MSANTIREANTGDLAWIMELALELPYLDCHTEHSYWILLRYGCRYVFVAEDEHGERLGFVSGVRSSFDPRLFFFWQLGVQPGRQRGGVAYDLTDAFFNRAEADGGPGITVNAAISRDNEATLHLLERWTSTRGWQWHRGEEISYEARDGDTTVQVAEDLMVLTRKR